MWLECNICGDYSGDNYYICPECERKQKEKKADRIGLQVWLLKELKEKIEPKRAYRGIELIEWFDNVIKDIEEDKVN